MKLVDSPLADGELPVEFYTEKRFMLVDEYFQNDTCKLPSMLRKMAGELETMHEHRVKMYLLACPDTKFSDIAEIIDPS
jgi:hypothetical protein